MTKKLENLFDLASEDAKSEEKEKSFPNNSTAVTKSALDNLDKIENALNEVRGLTSTDDELDELTKLAQDSYKDLQDLGMQVEAKYSAEIFNCASSFLGHAITAKTAKINRKLKTIELQLRKAALDQKQSEKSKEIDEIPSGEGQILDRNSLLKILSDKKDK